MNKHLIALAVAAATLSGAASAATVYSDDTSSLSVGGRIEATGVLQQQADSNKDNADPTKVKASNEVVDMSRARVNIGAKTQIADGVQGIGFFEKEFHSNTDASPAGRGADETRYVYAGVNSDQYGQLVYGKADGSLGMLTDFTDIMAYAGSVVGGTKLDVADRTNNNLAYAGTFGDLTFKANYVFAGSAYNKQTHEKTDIHGFSTGAVYKVADTGLALGLGYGEQRGQIKNEKGYIISDSHNDRAEQTFAVASYTMGDLYFGGLYKYGRRDALSNDDKLTDSQGYEFAAAYTMGKTVFTTTYGFMKDEKAHNEYDELANAVSVDGTYYFNSNFRTYASYTFNMLDKNKVGKVAASDQFVLGARYDF
ncbi:MULTISPECIES: porin [unclassified Photobacterium]|uniref:porin n=1 Tax=unclassified Photobacterium TaxID=2628852 RepID=UPI001EDDA6DF|nr:MULTISPECIES: porin [unclassified Photobacterium]MCG3863876.1 porin [Photobacterium sp. Ph6]MCG3875443.1 porin [Photobacterium sp. Ph5]